MGVMTDPPVCRLCGAAHWLREPHMFVTDVKVAPPPHGMHPASHAPTPAPDAPPPPQDVHLTPAPAAPRTISEPSVEPSKNPLTLAQIAIDATKRLKVAQDLLARLRAGEKVPMTNTETKRKSRAYRKLHPNYRRGRTNAQRQKAYRERKKKEE